MQRPIPTILLLLALSATPVWADPVRITSGVLSFDSGDSLHFVLEGDGFRVAGSSLELHFSSVTNPGYQCLPCAPGTVLNLDARFGPGDLGPGFFGGDGFIDSGTPVYFTGFLRFDTGATIAAALGVTHTPFTFSGELAGFLDASRSGVPVFQETLVGQGTLHLALTDSARGGGMVITDDMTYAFENMPAVPEPATMLLAGAGLAGIARRVIRKSSKSVARRQP